MYYHISEPKYLKKKKNGYNILPGDPGYPDDRLGFP